MNKGYIYLIFAALSYASMGVLVKALSVDLSPFSQVFLRLCVSGVLTLAFILYKKKSLLLKSKSDYLLILFMGVVGYGAQIVVFTFSLYHTTIGNALFIFSAYPIITALLAWGFLKEKLIKRHSIALILLSCILFLLFDPTHINKYLLGNTLAFLTCVTFAIYVICSRVLTKRGNSPEAITVWSIWLGVLTSGIPAFLFEHVTLQISPQTYIFILVFGLLNAAAWNLVNKGFATVKAGVGTMILLLEPVLGSFLGLLFFHEIPTMTFIIGAIIMITAIYIATFSLE